MIQTLNSAELRRVKATFRALPKDVKNSLRKYQRQEVTPIWKEEMAARQDRTRMSSTIFKSGTRVKAGAPMSLIAGAGTKKLSGGGTPKELAKAMEFGSNRRNEYTKYNRVSPKGKRHTVTRRTSKQLPPFKKGGYVAYPASTLAAKRIAKLSAQTMVRAIYQASER